MGKKERTILLINLITFFLSISYETVFTVLPFYLTTVLGTSMFVIGIIEGGYDLIANFVKIFSGYWSDFIKKKRFLFTAVSFSLISKIYFVSGKKWGDVLIATSLEAFSEGIITPVNDTYLSSGDKNRLGRIFGINRAFENIGAFLGILIALIFTWFFLDRVSYRNYFLISIIPVIFAFFLILFIPSEKKEKKRYSMPIVSWESFFPKYIALFLLLSVVDFGYSFYILRTYSQINSEAVTILFYLIFTVMVGLASLQAGKIFDRIGEKRFLLTTAFLFLISHFLMIVFPAGGFFTFAFADAFLDIGIWATVGKKIRFRKGFVFGTYHFTVGFASLISGMVAGYLWDTVSPESPFFLGMVISALTYIIINKYF